MQIVLKASPAIKQRKVQKPAQEIQFSEVKCQDGHYQIPLDMIIKIAAMSPPTSNKDTQAVLHTLGFWKMRSPDYSQSVSSLYLVTQKKNDFKWDPEQQQAFKQIKQEINLRQLGTGQDVKTVLYIADGKMVLPGVSDKM